MQQNRGDLEEKLTKFVRFLLDFSENLLIKDVQRRINVE